MTKGQAPFTPEQARALSRRPPTSGGGGHAAGTSSRGGLPGSRKVAKKVRRPGLSRDTGPSSGRNG